MTDDNDKCVCLCSSSAKQTHSHTYCFSLSHHYCIVFDICIVVIWLRLSLRRFAAHNRHSTRYGAENRMAGDSDKY